MAYIATKTVYIPSKRDDDGGGKRARRFNRGEVVECSEEQAKGLLMHGAIVEGAKPKAKPKPAPKPNED